jgi:hypothetical protein
MEQWNGNENIISIENETCEIFLNDVLMEKMFENYPSLEIESDKVYQNEKEKWKWTFSCMLRKLNGDLTVEIIWKY